MKTSSGNGIFIFDSLHVWYVYFMKRFYLAPGLERIFVVLFVLLYFTTRVGFVWFGVLY